MSQVSWVHESKYFHSHLSLVTYLFPKELIHLLLILKFEMKILNQPSMKHAWIEGKMTSQCSIFWKNWVSKRPFVKKALFIAALCFVWLLIFILLNTLYVYLTGKQKDDMRNTYDQLKSSCTTSILQRNSEFLSFTEIFVFIFLRCIKQI